MADQYRPVINYLTNHCDMAEPHRAIPWQGQNRTFNGYLASLVDSFRLIPPAMGIAINFDATQIASKWHALKIVIGSCWSGHDDCLQCQQDR